MNTLIVNLMGGPGAGKSTMAHRLVSEFKQRQIGVEFAAEYAKDLTWQESFNVLKNQHYVFAKQQHRIWRLDGKVPVIVTDSPLLFSLVYGKEDTSDLFKQYVIEEYRKHNTFNIYINRTHPYDPIGRSQSEDEAIMIDKEIRDMVNKVDKFHMVVNGSTDAGNIHGIMDVLVGEHLKLNP